MDRSDSTVHDQVNKKGSDNEEPADEWWHDAGWYASAFNWISIGTGFLSAAASLAAVFAIEIPPLAADLALAGRVLGGISVISGGISAAFTGIEYGLVPYQAMFALLTMARRRRSSAWRFRQMM